MIMCAAHVVNALIKQCSKLSCSFCFVIFMIIQLLKAYRIKFQKFAAHAHKDALINETFIPT